ncbi:ATP-binding protein [Aquibacillus saliphilus]|uniref:ATP-binding protein n=1 Tax=Aquibacillus saliphilus TaxID=1909422 RepID=UPI001CEFF8D6|nr:ATP-binding protein [Aquibacillus saliphilus]
MIKEVNGVNLDFHQLVENSMNGIIVIDNEEIIYINKTTMEILAIPESERIIGENILEFLHPDYKSSSKERLRVVKEDNRAVDLMEQKVRKFDGEVIDIAVVTAPYYLDGKTLTQVTFRDITELKEANNAVIQSEKLSLTGELAAGVVHEIRNPLTSIKGFLQLMLTGTIKMNDYIKIIQSEIESIENIANELLLFSKPDNSEFKQENIINIAKDVAFLLNTEAYKKYITINLLTDEKDINVLGNKTQLKQVFVNLIKNAIDATADYGEITISIEQKYPKVVSVKITDTGCGIPPEKLDKLGQSFFTTKEKGTGLGLMITHKIIKSHNGKITVTSEEGKGTTFSIQLPSN